MIKEIKPLTSKKTSNVSVKISRKLRLFWKLSGCWQKEKSCQRKTSLIPSAEITKITWNVILGMIIC